MKRGLCLRENIGVVRLSAFFNAFDWSMLKNSGKFSSIGLWVEKWWISLYN